MDGNRLLLMVEWWVTKQVEHPYNSSTDYIRRESLTLGTELTGDHLPTCIIPLGIGQVQHLLVMTKYLGL